MARFKPYRASPPIDMSEMGVKHTKAKIVSEPFISGKYTVEIEIDMSFQEGVIFRPTFSQTDYKIVGKVYKERRIGGRWSFNRTVVVRCDGEAVSILDLISLRKKSYIYRIGRTTECDPSC